MAARVRIWHKAPFVRYLFALIAGIVLQWHFQPEKQFWLTLFSVCIFVVVSFNFLSLTAKYKFQLFYGLFINLAILSAGALITWHADIQNNKDWFGHVYTDKQSIVVRLTEPLIEKSNSYKAEAEVHYISNANKLQKVTGNVILYLKKDTLASRLKYGSIISINKSLQMITNSGNPGGFDYKRYCLFKGITHQVFVSAGDVHVYHQVYQNSFWNFIYGSRKWLVAYLRKNIPGKREQGLAEALLIGYKDDLDKNLVQAYSNTGVVHIIAISGLHLGLIYAILMLLTRPIRKLKLPWLRLFIVLGLMWLFSILAGAQPSVLRSSVMFSFIAFGQVLDKKSSVYNTLALSAMALLLYHPFFLWDVGFQLSYAAVAGILIFYRPISGWIPFENKSLVFFCQVAAVTLAAQIFTLPISIFHFHQMPLLFLFSNIVAVPLGSLILIGEVILCSLFWWPPIARWLGVVITFLISSLNDFVSRIDSISFSVWNGLSISLIQLFLLLIASGTFCFWLLERQKQLFWGSLLCLLLFFSFRTNSFLQTGNQSKLIVYNVPKHRAIDVIDGHRYNFLGDDELLVDGVQRNFHLQPSRILHRVSNTQLTSNQEHIFIYRGKRVLIMDSTLHLNDFANHPAFDLIVLSGNQKLYINQLLSQCSPKQLIIDGSVPAWKAKLWQKDCDSLRIPCYNVSEKGAFVMTLR